MGLLALDKKWCFIHIYKAGGTSIKKALKPYATLFLAMPDLKAYYADQAIFPTVPNVTHARARDVQGFVGPNVWKDLYSFAVVRNPWEQMLSLYKFIAARPDHSEHAFVTGLTFPQFVEHEITVRGLPYSHWTHDAGDQLVTDIFRLEDIATWFPEVSSRCAGVALTPPHENRTEHDAYQVYYDGRSRDLVAARFRTEIQRFGYKF